MAESLVNSAHHPPRILHPPLPRNRVCTPAIHNHCPRPSPILLNTSLLTTTGAARNAFLVKHAAAAVLGADEETSARSREEENFLMLEWVAERGKPVGRAEGSRGGESGFWRVGV